jgi:L-iditol 2-dehydrogenase
LLKTRGYVNQPDCFRVAQPASCIVILTIVGHLTSRAFLTTLCLKLHAAGYRQINTLAGTRLDVQKGGYRLGIRPLLAPKPRRFYMMKAAVYYGKHDVRVTEVPVPEPGPFDVRIKIAYCGVCGTDLHIFNGDGGAAPVPAGTILGHEFSGVVDAVGSEVQGFQPGDRVCADPNDWCGQCLFCKNGQAHFCTAMKGYGTTYPGGFAQYVCVPEKQVYLLPDALGFQAASQSETLSCCVNGIDLCRIKAGSNVLILGAGPIGLMMLQMARSCGAGNIIISELVAEKRALALKLGADLAVDPMAEDLKAVLRDQFDNTDRVIEAAGTVATHRQAIELAGKACTVMLFGLVPPETEIALKPFEVFNRELTITSSFINPYTFTRAIRMLANRRVVMDDIISDIVPLDRIGEVFTDPAYRKRSKVLIQPNQME